MSNRESSDNSSTSGVSYPSGGGDGSGKKVKGIALSAPTVATSGIFNGHTVEVWPDRSVWDTVSGAYLFPGRDFDPTFFQRR